MQDIDTLTAIRSMRAYDALEAEKRAKFTAFWSSIGIGLIAAAIAMQFLR